MVARYQKRISGLPFDRFDIHIEVPRGDAAVGHERAIIPSRVEAGLHDCGFGEFGSNPIGAFGRSITVSTETATIVFKTQTPDSSSSVCV